MTMFNNITLISLQEHFSQNIYVWMMSSIKIWTPWRHWISSNAEPRVSQFIKYLSKNDSPLTNSPLSFNTIGFLSRGLLRTFFGEVLNKSFKETVQVYKR